MLPRTILNAAVIGSAIAYSSSSFAQGTENIISFGFDGQVGDGLTDVGGKDDAEAYHDVTFGIDVLAELEDDLAFGIRIDADSDQGGDDGDEADLDEAYVFTTGAFGTLQVGYISDVAVDSHVGSGGLTAFGVMEGSASGSAAPQIFPILGVEDGDWLGDDFYGGTLGTTFVSPSGGDRPLSVRYYTPDFSGLSLGVSFAPEAEIETEALEDMWSIGGTYKTDFQDNNSLVLSVGYSEAKSAVIDERISAVLVGSQFTGQNYNFGISYAEVDDSISGATTGDAYSASFAWAFTPTDILSVSYFNGTNVDDEHTGFGPLESLSAFVIGINRTIYGETVFSGKVENDSREKGKFGELSVGAEIGVIRFNEDVSDAGFGTPGDDSEGFYAGVNVSLSF